MKIERQNLENRQVELQIEVASDQLQTAMHSAARRLSRGTKIPGFRPGKAPYEVIVGKFGEDVIFEEALERLGQEIYRDALEESEIEPYAPGSLEEVIREDPLKLRYTVPLAPEVDLGAYREIRIAFEEAEVTDDAFEEAIEEIRQRQALIEPVDRPAEETDLVIIDLSGDLLDPEDEEEAQLLDMKDISVLVDPETDVPTPGVMEHLLGLNAGDEKSYEYTFPDDAPNEDLQKRAAKFHIKCLEVKSRFVPEWSDELAQNLGEFESLLDLRVKLRENLQKQAETEAETQYRDEIMQKIVEGASVEYPPIVLQEETENLLQDLRMRLGNQNLALEDYMKIEGKTEEDLREELEPEAIERIKRGLVLGKIVDVEELKVEDDEIDAEIKRLIEPLGAEADKRLLEAFESPAGRHRIAMDVLTDKAIRRIIAIAKGEAEEQDVSTIEVNGKEENNGMDSAPDVSGADDMEKE
ncbi:MAG: trigger factor [Chloroflexota bacterium]|nr:trigger factor [Chloroflexota bacterium]